MPIALDPRETFEIVLDSDVREVGLAPTFIFRYLTVREWREIAPLGDDQAALSALSTVVAVDKLMAALRLNLIGWANVRDRDGEEIAYGPDRLEDVLTMGEAWELYFKARRQVRLGADEKKDSGSPSPTLGGESAPEIASGAKTHPA
jgi:hypothetical protein